MFKNFSVVAVLITLVFVFSCQNRSKEANQGYSGQKNYQQSLQTIYYSLPSPVEIADLVQRYDFQLNTELLNSLNNVQKYESATAQAINLGIYSADFSFLVLFKQKPLIEPYYNAVYQLAQKLDLLNAIGDSLISTIEKNLDNPKQLESIFSDILYRTNAYLQDDNRQDQATLIILGGWVETMYLTLSLIKNTPFDSQNYSQIYTLIADQSLIINNLQNLIQTTNLKDKRKYLKQLRKINKILNRMRKTYTIKIYDKIADTTIVATKIKYVFTQQDFEDLYKTVLSLRKKYVNLH